MPETDQQKRRHVERPAADLVRQSTNRRDENQNNDLVVESQIASQPAELALIDPENFFEDDRLTRVHVGHDRDAEEGCKEQRGDIDRPHTG